MWEPLRRTKSNRARKVPPQARYYRREWRQAPLSSSARFLRSVASSQSAKLRSSCAVFVLHRGKKTVAPQAVDQSAVEVIGERRAAASTDLGDDVLGALDRGLHVRRRLRLEVGVADVDDPGIGQLELPGQNLPGERLVGEREVIALDHRLEEGHDRIGPGEIAALDHHAAEQPGNLLGREIE